MARGEVPSGVSEYVVAVAAAVSAWRAVESMWRMAEAERWEVALYPPVQQV